MSIQDDPRDGASREDDADERAYRRIIAAMDSGDIEEFAAAIGQVPDSVLLAPPSQRGRNKSNGFWSVPRRLRTRIRLRRET
jgi:hypothetical protein